MTTITLKINEHTKAGKSLLSLVKLLVSETKGVELIKMPNATTKKALKEASDKKDLNKAMNSDDLFEQLSK